MPAISTLPPRTPHEGPLRQRGGRSAATWVAATGAFLLVAAAATFIAVRWSALTPETKFGILTGLTGLALLAGRRLEDTLPATGGVVFHLGALLVPVDVAAVGLHLDLPPDTSLLAVGATTAVLHAGLAVASGSVWLRWTTVAATVAAATGGGALAGVPAPVLVAVAAVAVVAVGRRTALTASAVQLAGVAAAGPLLGALLADLDRTGLVQRAGWMVDAPLPPLLVAATAGVALVVGAMRLRSRTVAVAALTLPLAQLGLAWSQLDHGGAARPLSLAGAFLVVELVALGAGDDPLWDVLVHRLAVAAEVAGVSVALYGIGLVAFAPALDMGLLGDGPVPHDPVAAGVLVVSGLAWLVAERRRDGADLIAAVLPALVAVHAVAAVAAGTADPDLVAVAGAAAGAGLLVTPSLAARAVGALLLVWAPVTAAAAAVGLATGLVGAVALVARGRIELELSRPAVGRAAVALGAVTLAVGALAGPGPAAFRLGIVVVGLLLAAEAVDPADRPTGEALHLGVAAAAAVPLAWTGHQQLAGALVALVPVVGVAVWRRRPEIAFGATAPVVAGLLATTELADLARGPAGLALVVSGAVLGALACLAPRDWWPPLAAAGTVSGAVGLGLASADPVAFATALLVVGGMLAAAGLVAGQLALVHVGAAVVTLGLWQHLTHAGVVVLEAYAAPVAAHLLGAGAHVRSRRPEIGSWVAYALPVVVLGGAGLVERIGGGGGWHAVVAGAVGTAAVAAGGWRRLAAPLLLGTALLVAVVGHESIAVVAGVPTWAWLALAGSALLAVGVWLERTDQSPVDAGRRVAAVIGERFE